MPPPTTCQNIRNPFIRFLKVFNKKPIYKKATALWPSPLFLLHTHEMVSKNCSVNKPLYYAKLLFEKRQVFQVLKTLFKEIIELITLIKTFMQFFK